MTIINLHTLPDSNISSNSIGKLTRGSSLGAVGIFWEIKRNKLYQAANIIIVLQKCQHKQIKIQMITSFAFSTLNKVVNVL